MINKEGKDKYQKAMALLNKYDYESDKSVQAAFNLFWDLEKLFLEESLKQAEASMNISGYRLTEEEKLLVRDRALGLIGKEEFIEKAKKMAKEAI